MTWGIFKTDSVSDTVKKLQEKKLIGKEETKFTASMLDEISDKTLTNYVTAARKDREHNKLNKSAPDTAQKVNANERDKKRIAGMNKAKSYLTPGTAGHAKNQTRRTANEETETDFSLFSEKELDMLINEANNANMTAGAWINDFLHAQQRLMASKGMGGKDAKALALAAYYNHQAKGKPAEFTEGRMNLDAKEIKHINLKDKRNDAEIMEPRAQGEKDFVAQHTLIVTDEPNKDGTPNGADKISAAKGPKGQGAGKYDAKEKLGNQGITAKKGEFSEETCSTGPTATGDKAGEIIDTAPQEKKSKKTYGKFKQEIGHEIK